MEFLKDLGGCRADGGPEDSLGWRTGRISQILRAAGQVGVQRVLGTVGLMGGQRHLEGAGLMEVPRVLGCSSVTGAVQ